MGSGHWTDKDRFLAVFKINVVVFVLELLAGWYSGSLSMTSDSFHLSLHIIVSLVALASEFQFLGFSSQKIKRWSAIINIALFFPLAYLIVSEANKRLQNPPIVTIGSTFFIIAILGLAANLYTIKILGATSEDGHPKNENRLLLWIHMVFDALGSVIVIVGGILINRTSLFWLDPVASFILAGLIASGAILMSWKLFYGNIH